MAKKDKEAKVLNEPSKDESGKTQALSLAMDQIEKQFGKGSIMRLGDGQILDVETISTGSLSLDIALGIGGLPCGRVVEIFGPESSGKTTLTLQTIAEAQKMGKTCAFIDAEHALDPIYARKLGVNLDDLLISYVMNAQDLVPWKDAPTLGRGALLVGDVAYARASVGTKDEV